MTDRDTLLKIFDLARWAPSGDNTQPWRFEIVADDHIAVHGFDTRDHVIYDFQGRASQMAHGGLLETLRIAATHFGLVAQWSLREGAADSAPIYDVHLLGKPDVAPDPLFPHITTRASQRRPMKATPLTSAQREALVSAPGADFEVVLFESFAERWRVARLLWSNAKIRLTCPEAYLVHKHVIEWNARYSEDRIPDQAVGVDPVTAKLMRWVMHSWDRVDFFNRYLFGTIAPRIQLDLLPGLMCSAHVAILARSTPSSLVDYVLAGEAMQRLWLTVHAAGLHMQMEMTPVIFNWYVQDGAPISRLSSINEDAKRLALRFDELLAPANAVFPVMFARVGVSITPSSRSTRLPNARLEYRPANQTQIDERAQ